MAEAELITLAEAGRRLGLANLSSYRAKYDHFPEPARQYGRVRLWEWDTLRDWYATSIDHEHPWANARETTTTNETKEGNA